MIKKTNVFQNEKKTLFSLAFLHLCVFLLPKLVKTSSYDNIVGVEGRRNCKKSNVFNEIIMILRVSTEGPKNGQKRPGF